MNRRASALASLVIGTIAAGTAFVGVAYAYLSAPVSGTGTGTATTSSDQLTFTLTSASAGLLYPGGPAGTVTATVTNPFTQPVAVTSVVMTPTATGGIGTCAAASFTTSSASIPGTISPGSNPYSVSVAMDNDAENGCQGATVSLSVTINGKL